MTLQRCCLQVESIPLACPGFFEPRWYQSPWAERIHPACLLGRARYCSCLESLPTGARARSGYRLVFLLYRLIRIDLRVLFRFLFFFGYLYFFFFLIPLPNSVWFSTSGVQVISV